MSKRHFARFGIGDATIEPRKTQVSDIFIGQRYRQIGAPDTLWLVTGVVTDAEDRRPFAILVSEDGDATMDVDFVHLEDPEMYEHLAA